MRPLKLLLLDDSSSVRWTLAALLADAGHDVIEAESLADARSKLARDAAFDLYVLDLHLGDGEGWELALEIRARQPAAKIVVLTGSGQPHPIAGVDAVITKGGDPCDLVRVLQQAASLT